MRLGRAFAAFFKILFDAAAAERVASALQPEGQAPALPAPAAPAAAPAPKPAPARDSALTLLAALQREARLIDFLMETLDGYSDDQVGAAVRDIHRDSRSLIERWFHIEPAIPQEEGAAVELPAAYPAGRYRLVGNTSGNGPFRGSVVHHGWQATTCDLPQWTGSAEDAMIVAPAEVEVQ